MKRTAIIYHVLCWMMLTSLNSCTRSEYKRFHSKTSDVLYADHVRFLLDKSLLSPMKGYREVIPFTTYTSIFPSGIGIMGTADKGYSAVWLITHDSLYLVGLDNSSDRLTPIIGSLSPKSYKKMEVFLNMEFSNPDPQKKIMTDSISSPGVIFASWVNGVYYRKKARLSAAEDLDRWDRSQFEKMTFKDGILTRCDTIDTQPLTASEMKALNKKIEKLDRKLQKELDASRHIR